MLSPLEFYRLYRDEADYCPLSAISPILVTMVVTAEDVPFFEHWGFNLKAIWLSIKTNIRRRQFAHGASTISQQLAKNLYLSFEKSLVRKLREGGYTLLLEHQLTKEQILELYLNIIYFGNGQYGITNAARFYFSKAPADLTREEALALVVLLPGPTYLNPLVHPDHYVKRREVLLAHFELMTLIDAPYADFIRTTYPREKLLQLFHPSGSPLLDPTVPMKNDRAQALRTRARSCHAL